MTLSYNVGLTGGALAAYLLEKLLTPMKPRPCSNPTVKIEKTIDFIENSTLRPTSYTTLGIAFATATASQLVQDSTAPPSTPPTISDFLTTVNTTVASVYKLTTSNNEIH